MNLDQVLLIEMDNIIAKTIITNNVGINPNLVIDKKNYY